MIVITLVLIFNTETSVCADSTKKEIKTFRILFSKLLHKDNQCSYCGVCFLKKSQEIYQDAHVLRKNYFLHCLSAKTQFFQCFVFNSSFSYAELVFVFFFNKKKINEFENQKFKIKKN